MGAVAVVPIRGRDGEVESATAVVRDVTEQRAIEADRACLAAIVADTANVQAERAATEIQDIATHHDVPPNSLVVDWSACTNGSNKPAACSASMPRPVSDPGRCDRISSQGRAPRVLADALTESIEVHTAERRESAWEFLSWYCLGLKRRSRQQPLGGRPGGPSRPMVGWKHATAESDNPSDIRQL